MSNPRTLHLSNRTLVVLVVLFIPSLTMAQSATTQPAPGEAADFVLTKMRVQTLQGYDTFAYVEAEVSMATLKQTIDKFVPVVMQAESAEQIRPRGPMIFVYLGMTDVTKPFRLQIGIPVAAGTQPPNPMKVRALEPLKGATVTYIGALLNIMKPWEAAYAGVGASALTPTGEGRELYVYWEGPDSPNNVTIVQVGVK